MDFMSDITLNYLYYMGRTRIKIKQNTTNRMISDVKSRQQN